MIVDRRTLERNGTVRTANLAQRDRRGNPHVLVIVVLEHVDQRRHGTRVAELAQLVGGVLAVVGIETLQPLGHERHFVRGRR